MKHLLFILVISLLLLGCNTVWDETGPKINDDLDGDGYYTLTTNGYTLKYKIVSEYLDCKFTGETTGWVAVGFNPSDRMKDANFIIGYYNTSGGMIRDDYGDSPYSHTSDIDLGGTNDVSLIDSYEDSGRTTIIFQLPLDSGDSKDRILEVGSTYPVIFATGDDDNFTTIHNNYGAGSILLRQ